MPTTASIYRPLIAVLALFAALTGVIGVHAQRADALPAGPYGNARFVGQNAAVDIIVSPHDSLGSRVFVHVSSGDVRCTGETSTLSVTTDPPGATEFTVDPLLRNGHLPRTTVPCVANAFDSLIGTGGVYMLVIEVHWTENGRLQTVTSPPGMMRNQVASLVRFNVFHPDGITPITPGIPQVTGAAYLGTFVYAPV